MWGKTKFKNVRVSHLGYSFASKLEAAVFDHLKLLEKAQELVFVRTQPQIYLTEAKLGYRPDFEVLIGGKQTYIEAKGFESERWLIIRKLYAYYGPAPLHIYKQSGKNIRLVEIITPKNYSFDAALV